MSERWGTCRPCNGTGTRWVPIPGFPQVDKPAELTDDEKAAIRQLRTCDPDKVKAIEVTQRFFVRPCSTCDGQPGYSGDAMEQRRD